MNTEKIYCADCDCELTARKDWEPVMMLDSDSGETQHTRICFDCIDDIALLGYREIIESCRKELLEVTCLV